MMRAQAWPTRDDRPTLSFSPMRDEHLDEVADIERTLYDFPWSRLNFARLSHALSANTEGIVLGTS